MLVQQSYKHDSLRDRRAPDERVVARVDVRVQERSRLRIRAGNLSDTKLSRTVPGTGLVASHPNELSAIEGLFSIMAWHEPAGRPSLGKPSKTSMLSSR